MPIDHQFRAYIHPEELLLQNNAKHMVSSKGHSVDSDLILSDQLLQGDKDHKTSDSDI